MSAERNTGSEGPKQPPWGLIGGAIVVLVVVYAAFVLFFRVL